MPSGPCPHAAADRLRVALTDAGHAVELHDLYAEKFEGADGWIFVSRGSAKATASDPATGNSKAFAASDPKIINAMDEDTFSRLIPLLPKDAGRFNALAAIVGSINQDRADKLRAAMPPPPVDPSIGGGQ